MTPSTENRPRQVAWAGWLVVLGAAFSVATAFQVVAGARSLETREAISDFLADSPGEGLDLSVETTVQLLQASASVAAVVGAMMTVLGIYALRGDRRARLGLSLLALPLFVSGLALGGFLTSLAAAATGLLWISPAREWYAGLPLPPPPGSPRAGDRRGAPSRLSPWATPPSTTDRTDSSEHTSEHTSEHPSEHASPAGTDRPDASPAAESWAHRNPYATAPTRAAQPDTARPDTVTAAVAVTLICSGLVLVLTLLGLALATFASDTLIDELQRADPTLAEQVVDRSALLVGIWISGVLTVGAALLAIGLAVMTLARRRWAAQALVVVSWMTVVGSVLATISSPIAIVPAIAALVVISCLRRSREWFLR